MRSWIHEAMRFIRSTTWLAVLGIWVALYAAFSVLHTWGQAESCLDDIFICKIADKVSIESEEPRVESKEG
jgi:hypothetical protein